MRRDLNHRAPGGNRKPSELDGAYSVQDREMPAVASRATMVVRATVVMRMNFHCARRLNGGEVHYDEQNQQGPAQFSYGLAANTHKPSRRLDAVTGSPVSQYYSIASGGKSWPQPPFEVALVRD